MNNNPTTIIELEQWMKNNCFNFNSYSINGNFIYEGYVLEKSNSLYVWYYTERGYRKERMYFQTEKEAVEFAFDRLKSDDWANRHCIGFTEDKIGSTDLAKKLTDRGIKFTQDEIPYYGLQRPVYRTFVWGCDIKGVGDLRDIYYKAPNQKKNTPASFIPKSSNKLQWLKWVLFGFTRS